MSSKFHPTDRKPHPGEWSDAEQAVLADLYPAGAWADMLAKLPNRSPIGISRKANELAIVRAIRCFGWSEQEREILRQYYPSEGTKVCDRISRPPQQVKAQASYLKIRFRAPAAPAPKPPRAERPARRVAAGPKATPAPKAAPVPKVAAEPAPVAVKRQPKTPNLNAAKEARLRDEQAVKSGSITDALRKLPPNSPGRMVYMQAAKDGGTAATTAFRNWQKTQQQP